MPSVFLFSVLIGYAFFLVSFLLYPGTVTSFLYGKDVVSSVNFNAVISAISTASALVVIVIGLFTISNQRATNRRKATLDFIHQNSKDEIFYKALVVFIEHAKSGSLTALSERDKQGSSEVEAVRTVLNHYEIVALGIEMGILDEEVYKEWFGSSLVIYWDHAKGFVREIRKEKYPKAFLKLESLVERIDRKPARSRVSRWWKAHWG
jgi:hypothetical protein